MYKLTTINPPLAILKERKSPVRPRTRHPIQPSASTPVVAELHKEALQATGGPTSLGATSEDRVNPQLIRHDASAAFTAEADLGKSDPNDSISKQQGIDN
ncbi:hypothetical protein Tco_0931104 [Tanacetum coccineum]